MYLLEGNIGAGKSTLLSLIHKHLPQLEVITEPVTSWHTDHDGQTLLGEFYRDQKRWTYTMETFTLAVRIKEYLREQQSSNLFRIMERSIYSGYYCFAKNGYEHGFMTELEWMAYNTMFNFLVAEKCKAPQGFIYLQTPPDICHERTKLRNRSGEETIPLSYLQQIHNQHEAFLIHKFDVLPSIVEVPVLVLDGSHDFTKDPNELDILLEQISAFTQENSNLDLYKKTFDTAILE